MELLELKRRITEHINKRGVLEFEWGDMYYYESYSVDLKSDKGVDGVEVSIDIKDATEYSETVWLSWEEFYTLVNNKKFENKSDGLFDLIGKVLKEEYNR